MPVSSPPPAITMPASNIHVPQRPHAFVRWYNTEHRHSATRFVTPDARHRGEDLAVLGRRHEIYQAARARTPARWSGRTRNWDPAGSIWLNPERPENGCQGRGGADALPDEAGRGAPWPDTSETQRDTSSVDNSFDKHCGAQ